MIPAAIERNYPKRLLKAGWRQMGLFQRSVQLEPITGPGDKVKCFQGQFIRMFELQKA